MELKLNNQIFIIDEDREKYNEIHKRFVSDALVAAQKMEVAYWKCGNVEALVETLVNMFQSIIEKQCMTVCGLLYDNGIFEMTEKEFRENYLLFRTAS